jgi:hypothetical protein
MIVFASRKDVFKSTSEPLINSGPVVAHNSGLEGLRDGFLVYHEPGRTSVNIARCAGVSDTRIRQLSHVQRKFVRLGTAPMLQPFGRKHRDKGTTLNVFALLDHSTPKSHRRKKSIRNMQRPWRCQLPTNGSSSHIIINPSCPFCQPPMPRGELHVASGATASRQISQALGAGESISVALEKRLP